MLQYDFSRSHPEAVFNSGARWKKAQKVMAILKDACGPLAGSVALEIGCAAGFGSAEYATGFKRLVSADIDFPAVKYAIGNNSRTNVDYVVLDGGRLPFADQMFDVVICSHVYEHVPDAGRLMDEIHRVLKPGGACFFAAGNRFQIVEPHYRLPFLSVVPKFAAHFYLRVIKRGRYYYENHRSYWGLRRLVSAFRCVDYTVAIVDSPLRFHADDVVRPGTIKHYVARRAIRLLYAFCPTYLWVLKKS